MSKGGPEGNGEIRIPGEPGIAYAAPFLITHYVTAHGYRPPQVFINAVLAVDVDAWASIRWPDVPFPWVPEDAERLLELTMLQSIRTSASASTWQGESREPSDTAWWAALPQDNWAGYLAALRTRPSPSLPLSRR